MSQSYTAEQSAFAAAVSGFDACSADLASTMSRLEGELAATLLDRRQYDGRQAAAFAGTHGAIQDSMRGASQELTTMSTLIKSSFGRYDAGDSEVADQLSSLNRLIDQFPDSGRIINAL
jgi:uncharacterized phage infection (PIP) family protein YhgE